MINLGTDQDVIEHGLTKVRTIHDQPHIDGIVTLTIVNAHAVVRLFNDCANKALDKYLRITPPALRLSTPTVEAFWTTIKGTRASILVLMDHYVFFIQDFIA